MVPFYGWVVLRYGYSMMRGEPDSTLHVWCCGLFAFAAISDWVDGYLARKLEMTSQLGAYLDPFADKMLMLTSIIFMTHYTDGWWEMPIWFLVIVVLRDLLIIYGVWLLMAKKKPIYFDPHWTGKVCTGLQITVVSFYLLHWNTLGYVIAFASSVFTIWSGIIYWRHGWKVLHMDSLRPAN